MVSNRTLTSPGGRNSRGSLVSEPSAVGTSHQPRGLEINCLLLWLQYLLYLVIQMDQPPAEWLYWLVASGV